MPRYTRVPHPSTLKAGQERYVPLNKATRLHRVHSQQYASNEFNGTVLGNARFSPIYDERGEIIPTIYAAQTFEAATSEIILRCEDALIEPGAPPPRRIVSPARHRHLEHSTIDLAIELKLLDLTNAGQRRIGIDHEALLTVPKADYPYTRGWAEEIHKAFEPAQGFYYSSHQHGPDFCIVLFGDRVPQKWSTPHTSRKVSDEPCHSEIAQLARELGIDYEDI